MFCPNCGQQNKEDSKYCRNCGKAISERQTQFTHKSRVRFILIPVIFFVIAAFGALYWYFIHDQEIKMHGDKELLERANDLARINFGPNYRVANDNDFDYDDYTLKNLISPKRVKNPHYPYLVTGDFNGDGKSDLAIYMINDNDPRDHMVVVFHDGEDKPYNLGKLILWGGLDMMPKQTVKTDWESYTLKMKGDGIVVFKFESASRLLYWDGRKYSWYQLTD